MTLAQLNTLSCGDFVRRVGPVFEDSPWIAERTWPQRPFASCQTLHAALCATVQRASEREQIGLIQAHPDLAGRLARTGQLTRESAREQTSAGLNQLTPEERESFQNFNTAYREKFGFPFVICARLNQKTRILEEFRTRLSNSRPREIQTALGEIYKIADLRLRDLVES